MKSAVIILFLVGIIIFISGCTQEPVIEKENFTEEHFIFNSLDYAADLDTDFWPTKEAWVKDICQMCQIGMLNHSILGIQKCPGYPDETCNCPVSLKAIFDLTVPGGWDYISCKATLNDKLLETVQYNTTGTNYYIIDATFGSRIDENQTVELCCEQFCQTKEIISIC